MVFVFWRPPVVPVPCQGCRFLPGSNARRLVERVGWAQQQTPAQISKCIVFRRLLTEQFECDRCSEVQMINESHAGRWRDRTLTDILARMRHDGCGGRPARAELMTGIEAASSRARRIVLMG